MSKVTVSSCGFYIKCWTTHSLSVVASKTLTFEKVIRDTLEMWWDL